LAPFDLTPRFTRGNALGWSGSPVNFEPNAIEPGGFLSRAACQVFAECIGKEAEGKKVTEREAVFRSVKL